MDAQVALLEVVTREAPFEEKRRAWEEVPDGLVVL